MDKMIIATFDDEKKAYEASRILRELDSDGSIAIFAMSVIAKDASGKWTVKETADEGPLGTGVGLVIGTVLGLLGGPAGIAVGAGVGTLGGLFYDLAKAGVGGDFLADAGEQLATGTYAVVAELSEEWTMPVDARLEGLGGVVTRRARQEVVDVQLQQDAAVLKAELEQLKAERAQAAKEHRAKLDAKIEAVKGKLRATQDRTQAAIVAAKEENDAKINALRTRIAKARGDAKDTMDGRIAERRAEHERRSKLLHEAWELTKQALGE